MNGADIAKVQARLRSSLTVLAPERPLDLPNNLQELFQLAVAITKDGLEESEAAIKDALENERAA